MKQNRTWIPGLITLILSVITAAGVKSFLAPCIHEDGSFGVCHWAGQAVFGISILIAAQSAIAVIWNKKAMVRGLYVSIVLTAILGILFPGTLISLCGMATMRCRALMRPAVTILLAFIAAAAAAGALTAKDRAGAAAK